MSGYMLVWILIQKIEKLEEELNTYKNKTNKNWVISSEQFSTCSVFFHIKKICASTHIPSLYSLSDSIFKLLSI